MSQAIRGMVENARMRSTRFDFLLVKNRSLAFANSMKYRDKSKTSKQKWDRGTMIDGTKKVDKTSKRGNTGSDLVFG